MHLVFVYNAEAGALNAVLDIGHKILSPNTYACDLCTLTHGTFRERGAWKRFRESSSLGLTFFHKDEFEKLHGSQPDLSISYPVVLREGSRLEVFISTEELGAMSDPQELIAMIRERAT